MMTKIEGVKVDVSKVVEQFMVDIVWAIHGRTSSYEEIARLINLEFALNVSSRDVARLFDPTLEEDVEDLKLIYDNAVK